MKDFGSISRTFKKEVQHQDSRQAVRLRMGLARVWKGGKLDIISLPNQDSTPSPRACTPSSGNDVWEHAYYLKYQNKPS